MRNSSKITGFTIVELLIVIVVIAILAAIAVPAYNGFTTRAQTTSLRHDMQAMNIAQKRYMAQTGGSPITYDSSGEPNDTLAFIASKGNSILVRLSTPPHFCVYGFNPKSDFPDPSSALIISSSSLPCNPLNDDIENDPSAVFSTVAIIGPRLEQFYQEHGYYPHLEELTDIGLVIKPNSGNANQQQLYCRNDTSAIYLQIDKENDSVYVYVTDSHSVTNPDIDGKISFDVICEQYDIGEDTPGHQSTGIKNPEI